MIIRYFRLRRFNDGVRAAQLKGMTVYRQGSRGNEPLTPITVEQAIESLKSDEAVEGAAATDCPSGVCELPVSVSKE